MRRSFPLAVLLIAGCDHTDPVGGIEAQPGGPFSQAVPVRLTYSEHGDVEPAFSWDGNWVTYQYERGTTDRDRCIGVLPVAGGQRRWEFCNWDKDESTESNGLANAALRPDGMIAFTMHSSVLIGNLSSTSAALYIAPVDSIAGARVIQPLLVTPPGGSGPWQDLIDPVWVSADELLVLAARRHLINANCGWPISLGGCPFDYDRNPRRDTLQLGLEVARVTVTGAGTSVTSLNPALEAIAWSVDTSTEVVSLVVQRADPDDIEFYHESVADTLYQVLLGGGTPMPRYGAPQGGSGRALERLHGVASGRGRVFISRSWRNPADVVGQVIVAPGTALFSDIVEILPDGSTRLIAPGVSWRWGRLRLSADGRTLLAEAVQRNGSDIYRIELSP